MRDHMGSKGAVGLFAFGYERKELLTIYAQQLRAKGLVESLTETADKDLTTENRVLIVGAGAAGLTTAALLAQKGICSVVVDRSPVVMGNLRSATHRHIHPNWRTMEVLRRVAKDKREDKNQLPD